MRLLTEQAKAGSYEELGMHEDDLKKVKTILKQDGKFFMGMLEGDGEGWKENEHKFPGTKRWHARYRKEELENTLKENFKIVFFSRTSTINLDEKDKKNNKHYLNFICEPI